MVSAIHSFLINGRLQLKTIKMKTEKVTGYLLLAGAVGVFIPYTILTITFDYPGVLRQETSIILRQFYEGGTPLIFTWLAFALLGLPLLVAYSLIGQRLESWLPQMKWVTTIGILSGIVQIIGLLRWVFVVPALATQYVNTSSSTTREAIEISFKVIHQFAGVLLGEHIGQLFTIIWTVFISIALLKLNIIPKSMAILGFIASFIYFLAQAELIATVIPSFPVIDIAGFVGSTLWLVWLILLGVQFIRAKKTKAKHLVIAPNEARV